MSYGASYASMVDLSAIFLDHQNPRHKPVEDDQSVINALCGKEQVLGLAQDIAANGLNPLELFALIPIKGKGTQGKKHYIVAEGNRRLCALKLLNDPDLAPANQRDAFREAAENWAPIKKIHAIEFKDREAVQLWLQRTHGGIQGGAGRKQWDADQKQRALGGSKNLAALQLLDYAERKGYITAEQREGKLSTVQRYISNPHFRESMGLSTEAGGLDHFKSEHDVEILVKKFMTDLVGTKNKAPTISTRDNKAEIMEYSRALHAVGGLDGTRVAPSPLSGQGKPGGAKRKQKPAKPKDPTKLNYDRVTHEAIKQIPSYKLDHLYYSLCDIDLQAHTPLISIGLWALIETLTGAAGRNQGVAFPAFLTKQRLGELGVGNNEKVKAVHAAISRLSDQGNTSKHDSAAAMFHSNQLYNDFELIQSTLLSLATSLHK